MDEKGLRKLLLQRLHMELLLFKDSMLRKEKEDIFKDSYKIEVYVDLYEVFVENAADLDEDTMRGLLNLNFGILGSVYQKWMERKDGFYDDLQDYACGELRNISEMGRPGCGCAKEGEDDNATGHDQAA